MLTTFGTLALKCAPGVAVELLAAIASVESGFDPLAVRDGARLERAESAGRAVALAVGAIDRGGTVALGLMGLSDRQFASEGVSIADGFDACKNLAVAENFIARGIASGRVRGLSQEAAELEVVAGWWRRDGRFSDFGKFVVAVQTERAKGAELAKMPVRSGGTSEVAKTVSGSAEPSWLLAAEAAPPTARNQRPAASWDVFGSSHDATVLVFGKQKGTKNE